MKAVITGDIIQSTKMKAENREFVINELANNLKLLNKEYKMKSEIFRGDSFQCYLRDPKDALRVMLIIKTFIRGLNPSEAYELTAKRPNSKKIPMIYPLWICDARIALGIGEVDKVGTKLGTSSGQAFLYSGHLLDALKGLKQQIAIATADDFNKELQTEAVLLDHIINKTTALQCQVLNYKLRGYTETIISNELGINQSAVNQRSNAAGWNAINTMVQRFEMIYSNG